MKLPGPLLAARLRRAGIVHPVWTYGFALQGGVPLEVACAVEMLESSGGHNEFGHDPTIFAGAGDVTKAKYLAYRALRDSTGECQGVGPMQLTSRFLQDEADAAGGCWDPRFNIATGLHFLGGLIARDGLWPGVGRYNGSGPAADLYRQRAFALASHFKTELGL